MTFAPRTWVVGEVVSAALLNQEIRDQFSSILAAWTSYTPTWTAATTNPVLNNGTIIGRYMKVGLTCHVALKLTMGSTTTYGSGVYRLGVPFTSAASMDYIGTARLVAANSWIGHLILGASVSDMNAAFPTSTSNASAVTWNSVAPETMANGHIIRAGITYQTAT
ncbi:hypothetical protein [Streptomyces sp. NPDC050263]|uniref:hypothetical protein n=1 Tax=Streptomyces sp. NPDC050263 TaxID=3155037 RepID=UPI003415FEE1